MLRRARRTDRRLTPSNARDNRTYFQRDRDRILYTSAFRRLAGITQVAAPDESYPLHNRLTHSLEVAQIGRRIAERINNESTYDVSGYVNPDVVESAALAHDLGHPPFGHVVESELDHLITQTSPGDPEGFNGNAQSFRIVTKLAVRSTDESVSSEQAQPGLDLTRATLNAILKYPWQRSLDTDEMHTKWGAYASEHDDFHFARELSTDIQPSVEAELMDWADDVAYAVHDLEDFYRAGLVPIDRLKHWDSELDTYFQSFWKRASYPVSEDDPLSESDMKDILGSLLSIFSVDRPFEGTRQQRALIRGTTSILIGRFVNGVDFDRSSATLVIEPELRAEVQLLKGLTWHYVIDSSSLSTQQHGQRTIVRNLFEVLMESAHPSQSSRPAGTLLPTRCWDDIREASGDEVAIQRVVVDYISSMTERQALDLHRRLMGIDLGSLTDAIAI